MSVHVLPAWALVLDLAAHLGAGVAIGVLSLRGLWRIVSLLGTGGRGTKAAAWAMGRFILLGGLLTLASLEGAPQLLAMAAGLLAARWCVVRKIRETLS